MIIMRLLSSLQHDEDERGIYQLGHQLIKHGHQSIVLASADADNKLVQRLERSGNIYHQLAMDKKSWWSLLSVIPLRNYIKKYQPDIIHVHSRTPAWVLYWALKGVRLKKRPKIISTIYGFYPINKYAWAMLQSDVIISVSKSVTRYLHDKFQQQDITDKTVVRIYRGVNTRRYTYRHNPSVFWLRKIFAEFPELEHKKWLLFPSVIDKEYGQEWLIDILGNLQEKFPNIHAIIMDDDKDISNHIYEEFRQRAFALGLDKRLTFIGSKRNDKREWLSASNLVLALANEPESIGIPILQALHMGTPVVGWDRASYAEILRCIYPQGLVKEKNSLAVCKIVQAQLEIACYPPISNQFTLKQTIEETLQLYQLINDNQQIPDKFSELEGF